MREGLTRLVLLMGGDLLWILIFAWRGSVDRLGDDGGRWDTACPLAEIKVAVRVIAVAHTTSMCRTLRLAVLGLVLHNVVSISILLRCSTNIDIRWKLTTNTLARLLVAHGGQVLP